MTFFLSWLLLLACVPDRPWKLCRLVSVAICSWLFCSDCSVPPVVILGVESLSSLGSLRRRLAMVPKTLLGLWVFLVSSVAPSGAAHIPVPWPPLGCHGSVAALSFLTGHRAVSGSCAAAISFPTSCFRSWYGDQCVS